MKTLFLMSLLLLCSCKGPRGDAGSNGTSGAPGQEGPSGPPGLPGGQGSVPFTYSGTLVFPTDTVTQTIPDLNLEEGDILNVYLKWHSGPLVWSQIGSTWVGGMAGSYSVVDNVVTITVVTGVDTDWLINGLNK
jgi:hypothetical protein